VLEGRENSGSSEEIRKKEVISWERKRNRRMRRGK
jgi:hypothetical protein